MERGKKEKELKTEIKKARNKAGERTTRRGSGGERESEK